METRLIFRIEREDSLVRDMSYEMFAHFEMVEIVASRIGEDIILGLSDIPGIWSAVATAKLADWTLEGQKVSLRFSNVEALPEPIGLVTAGDREADSAFRPYQMDAVEEKDLPRSFQSVNKYEQSPTPHAKAAEVQQRFEAGRLSGGLRLEAQDETFFHKVGRAYAWACCVSGMGQRSLDQLFCDGVVLGVGEPLGKYEWREADGLFFSSSFGFAYRHGLLAIGDDYEILRHRALTAEMRMFLEVCNPKAMLWLPSDPLHWPNLEAARRHRTRFGY